MHSIIIDARMLFSSGIGVVLRNMLVYLAQARLPYSWEIIVQNQEQKRWVEKKCSSATIIVITAPIYSIKEQLAFLRLKSRDAKLFWSPHYNIPIFWQKKIITTIHDVCHVAMPHFFKGFKKQSYARNMLRWSGKKSRSIVCVSEFTAKEFHKYTDCDPKKICVIYNGVSQDWFEVVKMEKSHSNPYILFVGNVKPHKNLDRLLDAFNQNKEHIPHDLVVVGKKEGFITGDKSIMQKAATLDNRVRFTGEVSDAQLKQYYAWADFLCFPSLYEGFGLPALEAMACGCPVLTSNVTSLPEVAGEAAVYCDPYSVEDMAEKLKFMVSLSEEKRQELISKGRERAKLFSWEKAGREFLDVIKKVAEE
ncbi:MAG: glycosyltransferase family 4 protein [Verrucomicrobiota bacterium]